VEIDIPSLEKLSSGKKEVRPLVDEYKLKDGRKVYLLAEGRLVNLSTAEGHPASVMDMSFANQALSAEYLRANYKNLKPQVYVVPEHLDKEIARLKLESMGHRLDKLTRAGTLPCFLAGRHVTLPTIPGCLIVLSL